MNDQKYPPCRDSARVQRLIAYYEALDEDAQVAGDEAALDIKGQTTVVVPVELMPAIRQMLAQKSSH